MKVAICSHQADSPFYLLPDVWSADCKHRNKCMIIHDTECPFWNNMSLKQHELKLYPEFAVSLQM